VNKNKKKLIYKKKHRGIGVNDKRYKLRNKRGKRMNEKKGEV